MENPAGATSPSRPSSPRWTGEALDKKTAAPAFAARARHAGAPRAQALRRRRRPGARRRSARSRSSFWSTRSSTSVVRTWSRRAERCSERSRPGGRSWRTTTSARYRNVCWRDDRGRARAVRLGVPVKTRHNEVAPGQFEMAPIYETREHRGGPSAARHADAEEGRAAARAGGPAAREAVRGSEREREAPELVARDSSPEPPGAGRDAAREPPVPLLLHGGVAGGRASPGPVARDGRARGERSSAGRERGAAGDHLGLPGRPAAGHVRPARACGRGEDEQERRAARARRAGRCRRSRSTRATGTARVLSPSRGTSSSSARRARRSRSRSRPRSSTRSSRRRSTRWRPCWRPNSRRGRA